MKVPLVEKIKREKELFDIFAARQEYSSMKDEHGRFIYKFSNYKNAFDPVVSSYLVKEGIMDIAWPEGFRFAACLTHDIDHIHPNWKHIFSATLKLLKNQRLVESFKRFFGGITKSKSLNPYWNFRYIIELENKYDAKSTFFFKSATRDFGSVYDINELTDEFAYIVDMGWEVGLHGGYYSYNDPKELAKERERVEKVVGKRVIGVRMHYLRFQVPDTWNLLAQLGFKYDTTFGYPDMPGFRNGMCHPFKPYDLNKDAEIDILEIPLVVMDTTFYGYMRISPSKAYDIIKRLIDVTERNNGVITILWHNNTFDELRYGDWAKLYEKILMYLKEKKAWMTSAEEIYNYWISSV